MNYLAPITLLAALITTTLLFSPASARAQENTSIPGIVSILENGADMVLEDDVDDAYFNAPLETPKLPIMSGSTGASFEFITLRHIFFDHDSIKFNDEALQILDGAAFYLVDNDSMIDRILIHGHTSNIANTAYNLRLSDSRAYAVWDYLAGRGVDPERMTVAGQGENKPIDENWTRKGRERNRRVEIQIIKKSRTKNSP